MTFPRIRGGDPTAYQRAVEDMKLFPAYAGVIPRWAQSNRASITFPRIRGGDPVDQEYRLTLLDFSPHTRG